MENLGMTAAALEVCRCCHGRDFATVLDLGVMPLANALRHPDDCAPERRFPLVVVRCLTCGLAQLDHIVSPHDVFTDYPYFSSYSRDWVEHAQRYAAAASARLGLGATSLVVEVASNDGYLLRHFHQNGIPVLGVEPAANVAAAALAQGIATVIAFFGLKIARELVAQDRRADLVVANNVLAHVPDPHDFVAGLALLLKPDGVLTLEFPHLSRLLEGVEFDTIYHEHFSYFSFDVVERILTRHGLTVFDVEELPTHGGSLRVWAGTEGQRAVMEAVARLRERERAAGLDEAPGYQRFADRVGACRSSLRAFFTQARSENQRVAAYGAAAKGATLLNYCGITADDLAFVADRNPRKQGYLMPGSLVPIVTIDRIAENRPDYLLILPWNLKDEIVSQIETLDTWSGRFVVPVPITTVLERPEPLTA